MEKFITATGKTIDLAIAAALEELHMDRDSVSVEVLENPRSGFLGIGAQPARVKVTYEAPDEAPKPALSSASRSKPKKPAESKRLHGLLCRLHVSNMGWVESPAVNADSFHSTPSSF